MTRRLALRFAAAFLALMATLSCSKERVRPDAPGGTVTFRFATGGLQNRATTPGDGTVADGGGIYASAGAPDLVILIADPSTGTIVKRYDGGDPTSDGELQSLTGTEATVAFDFSTHPAGMYKVYAFGNTEGLWPMTTDGVNTLSGSDLADPAVIADESDILSLEFKPLAADTAPALVDLGDPSLERLPLAAAADLEVKAGKNGQVRLELLRCVAKVTAEFINNTGSALSLTDFSYDFVGLCPDRGYVLPHAPDAPVGLNAGDLTVSEASLSIPVSGHVTEHWYVFPSTGPYTCDVSFRMGVTLHSYSDLPVTDARREDIPFLARNQHLHIVTRISQGLTVSFNFEVADWVEKSEEVQFD